MLLGFLFFYVQCKYMLDLMKCTTLLNSLHVMNPIIWLTREHNKSLVSVSVLKINFNKQSVTVDCSHNQVFDEKKKIM